MDEIKIRITENPNNNNAFITDSIRQETLQELINILKEDPVYKYFRIRGEWIIPKVVVDIPTLLIEATIFGVNPDQVDISQYTLIAKIYGYILIKSDLPPWMRVNIESNLSFVAKSYSLSDAREEIPKTQFE